MKFFFKKIPLLILFITALCLLALSAQAQNSVIPYQGTLFSQGKPVSQDAPVQMAFAIYNDRSELDSDQLSGAPASGRKWTSWGAPENENVEVGDIQTLGVNVRNGRFLVHLGEDAEGHDTLEMSIFDTHPLYVVTWVINSSGTFRLPPQKLQTVPHAVTAERATNFEVTHELRVKTIRAHGANTTIEVVDDLELASNLRLEGVIHMGLVTTILNLEDNDGSDAHVRCSYYGDPQWKHECQCIADGYTMISAGAVGDLSGASNLRTVQPRSHNKWTIQCISTNGVKGPCASAGFICAKMSNL